MADCATSKMRFETPTELNLEAAFDEICSKGVDGGFLEEGGVPSPVTWKKRRHTDAKDTPRR
jgi:hypothetical protein